MDSHRLHVVVLGIRSAIGSIYIYTFIYIYIYIHCIHIIVCPLVYCTLHTHVYIYTQYIPHTCIQLYINIHKLYNWIMAFHPPWNQALLGRPIQRVPAVLQVWRSCLGDVSRKKLGHRDDIGIADIHRINRIFYQLIIRILLKYSYDFIIFYIS